MSDTSPKEVYTILSKLTSKNSSGPDGLSNRLIKTCADIIAKPLSIIYNASIKQASYPDKWKLARVIALYKKGSRSKPENYRPISLLDSFGKIFERLIYNRMNLFIEKYKLLYIKQYAFRINLSTTFALIDAIDLIKEKLDSKNCVIGLFLDIEKAFDCVNHTILLEKLYHED